MVLEMKITNSTINSHVFGKPFILGSVSVNSNESECKENIVVFLDLTSIYSNNSFEFHAL